MAAGSPFDRATTAIDNSDDDEGALASRRLGAFQIGPKVHAKDAQRLQKATKLAQAHRKTWSLDSDFNPLDWTPTRICVYFKRFSKPTAAATDAAAASSSFFGSYIKDLKFRIGGIFQHCETFFMLEKLAERRSPPWLPQPSVPPKHKAKQKQKQKQKNKQKHKHKHKQKSQKPKRPPRPPEQQEETSLPSMYDEDEDSPGYVATPAVMRMPRTRRKHVPRQMTCGQKCNVVVAVKVGRGVIVADKGPYDGNWEEVWLDTMPQLERELCFDAQVAARGRPFSSTMDFNGFVRYMGCGFLAGSTRSLLPVDYSQSWGLEQPYDALATAGGMRDDDANHPDAGVFCSQLITMSLYKTKYEPSTINARTSSPEHLYAELCALRDHYNERLRAGAD